MTTDRGRWSNAVAEARLRRLEAEITDPIRRTTKVVPGDRSDPVLDRPDCWDAGNGSGPARPKLDAIPVAAELAVTLGPSVVKAVAPEAGLLAEAMAEGTHQAIAGQYESAVRKVEATSRAAADSLSRLRRRRRSR